MHKNSVSIIFASLFIAGTMIFNPATKLGAQQMPCTGHGNVDCSLGPDADGSVICLDGFTGDPTAFKDAAVCWDYTNSTTDLLCTPPQPLGCLVADDYKKIQARLSRTSDLTLPESVEMLRNCKIQIEAYAQGLETYDVCVQEQENNNQNTGLDNSLYTYTLNHLHAFCHKNFGYESLYDEKTNRCTCLDQYATNPETGRCESKSVQCNYIFGSNTVLTDKGCECQNGYEFNWNTTNCQKIDFTQTRGLLDIFSDKQPRPASSYTIEQITEGLSSRINEAGRIIYTERPKLKPIGYMIKAHSDPKAYLVMPDGVIRWVASEEAAKRLFGPQWDSYIIWLEESLIYTYPSGKGIAE